MTKKILNVAANGDGTAVDVTLYGTLYGDWFCGSEEEQFLSALRAAAPTAAITVHINSEGGDMFAGIALRNVLAAHKGPVMCLVEGLAASAASIVAMAGKTVMGRGAMLMVHNPWTIAAGNADELRAAADMLDKAGEALVEVYSAKTGKSADELRTLLKTGDVWMTSEEAVAAGFADEIAEAPMAVEARGSAIILNAVQFARDHVPARILAMAKTPPPKAEGESEGEGKKGPCNCASCGIGCPCGEEHCGEACLCPCDKGMQSAAGAKPTAVTAPREVLTTVTEEPGKPTLIEINAAITDADGLAGIVAKLDAHAPALLASVRAAAVAAERARLQEIDDLEIVGHEVLVAAAKYGEKPQTAEQLALAVVKAERAAGGDMLAARRKESAVAASVRPTAPNVTTDADVQSAISSIAAGGSARRGGSAQ